MCALFDNLAATRELRCWISGKDVEGNNRGINQGSVATSISMDWRDASEMSIMTVRAAGELHIRIRQEIEII